MPPQAAWEADCRVGTTASTPSCSHCRATTVRAVSPVPPKGASFFPLKSRDLLPNPFTRKGASSFPGVDVPDVGFPDVGFPGVGFQQVMAVNRHVSVNKNELVEHDGEVTAADRQADQDRKNIGSQGMIQQFVQFLHFGDPGKFSPSLTDSRLDVQRRSNAAGHPPVPLEQQPQFSELRDDCRFNLPAGDWGIDLRRGESLGNPREWLTGSPPLHRSKGSG